MDSNHRSETQQIYSLPPLATRELLYQLSYTSVKRVHDALGDPSEIRTPDTLIKSQVLDTIQAKSLDEAVYHFFYNLRQKAELVPLFYFTRKTRRL